MAEENVRGFMKLQSGFARMGKRIAIATTFGVLCFVVGAPSAQAEDRNSCQVRVERAEHRLNDAIYDHGYNSHQANDRRRDLERERERCWNQFHGYGNGRDQQWQNDRNRDRDDRNANRDRDDRNHDRDDGNRYQEHYDNRDSR
jgi:hypothetical protein